MNLKLIIELGLEWIVTSLVNTCWKMMSHPSNTKKSDLYFVLSCSERVRGFTALTRVQSGRCQEVQIHLASLQYLQSRLGLADSARHFLRGGDGAVQRVFHRRRRRSDAQHDRQRHRRGDSVHHRLVNDGNCLTAQEKKNCLSAFRMTKPSLFSWFQTSFLIFARLTSASRARWSLTLGRFASITWPRGSSSTWWPRCPLTCSTPSKSAW